MRGGSRKGCGGWLSAVSEEKTLELALALRGLNDHRGTPNSGTEKLMQTGN